MADEEDNNVRMKAPIFIVGANRSGTTLIRLILNAHSRIAIPEELAYFNSYVAAIPMEHWKTRGIPIEQWQSPELSPEEYARFVTRFLEKNCKPLKELDITQLRRELLDKEPADLRLPYRWVLESWARYHGKPRWGEKTPGNLFYSDIILEMFPDARFIHVVRDPRAGVCSMLEATFFPDDVVFNALDRHKHMTVGRAILEKHVPSTQRMTVRYEDLVTAPDATIRAICSFLEEAFEPSMLRYYEDSKRYMKQEAASTFNAAAVKPISTAMIDKWRHKLTTDEVAIIEKICAGEMDEFGYAFTHYPLHFGDRMLMLLKTAVWDVQGWRHRRIRHYCYRDRMFGRTRTRLERLNANLRAIYESSRV